MQTPLESGPFINFGIPQASVFPSLLTLNTHREERGRLSIPADSALEKPGDRSLGHPSRNLLLHTEELTPKQQTLAGQD